VKPTDTTSRQRIGWVIVLLAPLGFRTVYGLCSEFWFADELQVYPIGLKYYTTGLWPYFGPDVVYTQSQIPGALLGLLVGCPFFVCPLPEAPTLFSNLLSFGALALFAWYLARRFPDLPRWFVWTWTLTCPWAMVYSTRVINLSYMLPFAVLFFLAIFELLPLYEQRIIPARIAFFLVGLSIAAVMQLHLSGVLMAPLAAAEPKPISIEPSKVDQVPKLFPDRQFALPERPVTKADANFHDPLRRRLDDDFQGNLEPHGIKPNPGGQEPPVKGEEPGHRIAHRRQRTGECPCDPGVRPTRPTEVRGRSSSREPAADHQIGFLPSERIH
jgi:hypothetical protein